MANLNKLYKCVGENFKDRVKIGFCGDTKSLAEWINILFVDEDKQTEMCKYSENYIIEMIYIGTGKHLEKVGKI